MSFPKAKLHRFNEDISCAPPPGRYDPKIDSKVKGAVIETSKRFPDQLCASSSLDSLDKSHQTQITFRTPQVTRKLISLTPRLKYLQEKKFDTPGSDSSLNSAKSEENLEIVSKQKKAVSRADFQRLEKEYSALLNKYKSELGHRDSEITKLKNDLKEIKNHEEELKLILEEKSALALDRHKEVLEMKINLDTFVEKIDKERLEHRKYIDELKEEILQLQAKKEDLEGIIAEKQCAIVSINDKYLDLETEIKALQKKNESYLEEILKVEEINSEVLSTVVIQSERKVEELDQNLRSKVINLEQEFEIAQQKFEVNYQSKLNLISHEFDLKASEIENCMKNCFAKIEELENIIDIKTNDFLNSLQEADETCKYVYNELCMVEAQRDELLISDLEKKLAMVEIQEKSSSFEADLETLRDRCKNYEITLNTMKNTIKALSDRLLESDTEVERLSKVEVDLETQKRVLEEKTQLLLVDITALRDSMDKMEKDIIYDVTAMKENLAAKVDHFKVEASKQIRILNNELHEKQSSVDMLLNENDFYKKELEKKEEYILTLQSRIKRYKEDNDNLKQDCLTTKDELSEKLIAQKNLYKILSDELKNANDVIKGLLTIQLNNESQISNLTEENEKYETAIVEAEREINSLKQMNSKELDEINFLKCEINTHKELIEKKNKKEIKQQKFLDELRSDIIIEKERCEALEAENKKINCILSSSKKINDDKSKETHELTSKLKSIERSLKNAEEKLTVVEEAKATLEMQFIELEKHALDQTNIMSKSIERLEDEICKLQSSLIIAEQKMENEIPKLEQDNINKAQHILDLSINIDTFKDVIKESETRISCLEAEKSSLNFQLVEASNKISTLESSVEEKNMIINNLTNNLNIENAKYHESLVEIESLHITLAQHNEELKSNVDSSIKLSEAEEQIFDLQEKLASKQAELQNYEKGKHLEAENAQMRDELEDLRMRLQVVTDERNKLDQELADLMGHQNIQQKIKHVQQLKQSNVELREKADKLEIENTRLRKKLADRKENGNVSRNEISPRIKHKNTKKELFKENENIPRSDCSPKMSKPKSNRKSPVVLRDRNL